MKEKILIVEDHFVEANGLKKILLESGYEVLEIARSGERALSIVDTETPDFVLLDIALQGVLTGIDVGGTLRKKNIPFLYISANAGEDTLKLAKPTRPYGFLVKPFRKKDILASLEIGRYWHQNSMEYLCGPGNTFHFQGRPSGEAVHTETASAAGIVGRSKSFMEVLENAQIVARYDTSVLLLGESGTGKEIIAQFIHQNSPRNQRPLVKVNCAAIPSMLIESVLFGHERGSFTGAMERHIGKFEQAQEGTIFLDEVGDMSPDLQIKLLRVLQEKEIERVGSAETIPVNVRVIAATNLDLEKEVFRGRFRLDLFYRLNAFPLVLPPLKHRKDDIPALARHFIGKHAARMKMPPVAIAPKAMEILLAHDWPGNIRELEQVLERALVLSNQRPIESIALGRPMHKEKEAGSIKTMEENERDHIVAVLRSCGGKIFGKGGAAEMLAMNPNTLYSRIRKIGIDVGKIND
ncbi:MAG TPA: sigma-54 dependent transcriptional regulator [Puia sp.]|nr:sigma-54 dependent transcriptional regulator [Puia sp.]